MVIIKKLNYNNVRKNTKHGNERHMTTKTRSGNKFTLLNDQQKIWTRY
jgi:hypothetical protein